MTGTDLPMLRTRIPGPASEAHIDRLARHECPAITARRARRAATLGSQSEDPIVWRAAVGSNVEDVDGNRYVDFTSGFAVSLVGHRHPEVVRAVAAQQDKLLHAMGDAFPDATRIALMERLAAVCPGELSVSILGLSGADAVDAAVKTAVLATGKSGVLSFGGSYHGLSLGTVALQAYAPRFSAPFRDIAHPAVHHLPFGGPLSEIEALLQRHDIGLLLVEPLQGRGGIRVSPPGWLAGLKRVAHAHGALLAHDEIQSGLGRTGQWWAGDHDSVVPDLLCLGKALGGGFPLSACVGTPEVMAAWGASQGEAIHTQTFLGHPVGCAAGLAVLDLLEGPLAPEIVGRKGEQVRHILTEAGFPVRGRGLMLAAEVDGAAFATCRALLRRGYIALPVGSDDRAIGLLPPATVTEAQIRGFAESLVAARAEVAP